MKRISIFLLLLGLFCSFVRGQEKSSDILFKMVEAFSRLRQANVVLTGQIYSLGEDRFNEELTRFSGQVMYCENQSYFNNMGIEIIHDREHLLTIDNGMRALRYQRVRIDDKQNVTRMSMPDFSAMDLPEMPNITVEKLPEGNYLLSGAGDGESGIIQTLITVSGLTWLPTRFEYRYKAKEPGETTRVIVEYSYKELPANASELFRISRYIQIKGDEICPLDKYKHYEILQ